MSATQASRRRDPVAELEAMRDLLQAIADLLDGLPIRDEDNAIARYASAYCQAHGAAQLIDSALQHDLMELGDYVEHQLRQYTIKALATMRGISE